MRFLREIGGRLRTPSPSTRAVIRSASLVRYQVNRFLRHRDGSAEAASAGAGARHGVSLKGGDVRAPGRDEAELLLGGPLGCGYVGGVVWEAMLYYDVDERHRRRVVRRAIRASLGLGARPAGGALLGPLHGRTGLARIAVRLAERAPEAACGGYAEAYALGRQDARGWFYEGRLPSELFLALSRPSASALAGRGGPAEAAPTEGDLPPDRRLRRRRRVRGRGADRPGRNRRERTSARPAGASRDRAPRS